jgi:glutamyl/glutaminyl-tRNA synthetase
MKVRFTLSPTGSLHVGNALAAVINRSVGGTMLLRIDDTDAARNLPGGEAAILADLAWLGVGWDEGPVRQSERQERYRAAATGLRRRFNDATLLRDDGMATSELASVVDDVDLAITHVINGNDHRPNDVLQRELSRALGSEPPAYLHFGLVRGPDGKKSSTRAAGASIASLRDAGFPAEAVRAYLEELGWPRHDVRLDLARVRSLAASMLAGLPALELAAGLALAEDAVPALRRARDLNEGRALTRTILEPPAVPLPGARETLERFRELRGGSAIGLDPVTAKAIVRELKAVGGHLRAVRVALTGRESGPELWAVLAALPRDESLRRVDAAL